MVIDSKFLTYYNNLVIKYLPPRKNRGDFCLQIQNEKYTFVLYGKNKLTREAY